MKYNTRKGFDLVRICSRLIEIALRLKKHLKPPQTTSSILSFLSLICFYACSPTQTEVPLPFFNNPDFTPEWIQKDTPEYSQIHRIAPFEFIDQDSLIITNKTFEGSIYVSNFFFTSCPSICPIMSDHMEMIQEAFYTNDNIKLISHTVTPWLDSIPTLKAYAEYRSVKQGKWHMVTGPQEEIYEIARKSYFAEEEIGYQKSTEEFLHTEHFILVDYAGRIRGVYNGTLELETKRLIEDIEVLIQEL